MIYVGTFSKSLLPSLRAGYLVAPRSLRERARAARPAHRRLRRARPQLALARFLDDGLLARHLREAAKAYAERRAPRARGAPDPLARGSRSSPPRPGCT